jgi:hypothetical protein
MFLLGFFSIGFLQTAFAQPTTVTVAPGTNGSGNVSPAITTTPTILWSRGAYVYTAAEMTAAGNYPINGQKINKIRLDNTVAQGYTASNGTINIYMKQIAGLAPGVTWATEISTATQVANLTGAAANIPATIGWIEFPLSTPFTWNSSLNLEVLIEFNKPSAGTGIGSWRSVVGPSGTTAAYGTGNATPPATLGASSINRPNMQFDFINAGNCNPVITPGNSVALPSSTISTPVCPNSAVLLSISGISVGDLQTYTWQYSSDGVTNWTNLYAVPQNNFLYTANPTELQSPSGSLHYRCEIICNGGTAVYSSPVQTFVKPWLNGGTYTIDASTATGGTNFQSFTAAASAIGCGINGPVVFNVLPLNGTGVYTEQVEFLDISNTSSTNTITINGNGNKITFNATLSAAPWTFMLSGTDWVRVNNLQMESQALTIGLACHLWKQADNNIFTGCTMIAPANTTTTGNTPFSISGVNNSSTTTGPAVGNNNTLDGCTIRSGGIGIAISGTSVAIPSTNQVVKNCTILDINTVGIQTANTTGLILRNNLIERPTRTTFGAFVGIALNGGTKNALIEQNRVRNPYAQNPTQSTNSATGIFVNSTGTLVGETITVQNNLVSEFNSNGTINGIQTASGSVNYLNIYHNTIVFNNSAANPAIGADAFGINAQTSCAPGLCNLMNNNVYISRPAGLSNNVCLRFNTGATGSTAVISNYNNLFLSSNATGNFYANAVSIGYPTFSGWQAISRDINSVSFDPAFINPAGQNYTPNSPLLDNLGTNLGVITDINGIITRSVATPDIGAYEYTPVADAGITWVSPNAPLTIGNQTIVVNIVNNSAFAITSLSLSYTDGVTTVTEPFTSLNIAIAGNQNITFVAPYNFTANATITATILSVNGGADANASNNNAVKALCTQMSGAYTINALAAASSTNFQSFTAFANQINCGGISGPVIVTVAAASGPYNEQIQLGQIIGSSSVNTITINGNGQTLIFNSTSPSFPSTLELNGTDYLTVDNLLVEGTGPTYALACHLWNQANSNTFNNCTFTVPAGTALGTHVPFSLSGSQTSATVNGDCGNLNTVSNSTLNNGANGYNLYGGSTAGVTTGNKVLNCLIKDFNVNGIISFNNTSAEFTGNTIERPTRVGPSSIPKGVILAAGTQSATVSYNKIRNLFGGAVGTSQAYGIQTTVNPAVGFENRIINNLIYQFVSNNQIYGIDINVGGNARIFHNTIIFDDLTSTATQQTYGIFVGASGSACEVKNNNIYINRSGNGTKQCLSFSSGLAACDHNNLFNSSPAGTNYIGFSNPTGYSTLALWNLAFPAYDLNSKSVDPLSLNPSVGDFTPQNGSLNNTGTPVGVTTDINAALRSLTTPDIGAYEFSPVNFDAAISWVSPVSPGILGSVPVVVSVTNNQSTVITDLVLAYNDGGADVTQTFSGLNITNGNSQQFTFTTNYTVTAAGTLNAKIISANGSSDGNSLNDITSYNLCIGVVGTFTIDAGQPASASNFISFNSAIASLACGIGGPVVFNVVAASGPYNEQVVIPQIAGSSAVNTITINGNGNTLTFAGTAGNPNTLTLTGADYFSINNIIVIGTNPSAAIAGHLWNFADNNTFNNCTFTVPMGSSTTNAAFSISGSLTSITLVGPAGNNNVLDGCTFNNGGSNVAFVGNTAPNFGLGNVLKNSILNDFFQYGVALNNQNGALVSKNSISRPNQTFVGIIEGIRIASNVIGALIEKNRIGNLFAQMPIASSTTYGIGLNTTTLAGIGTENKIVNNLIYSFNGGQGVQVGINLSSAPYTRVYHNTIVFDDAVGSSNSITGLNINTTNIGQEVKNNIFYITRGSSSIAGTRCISNTASLGTLVSNANNFYIANADGNAEIVAGFGNSLANWQAGGYDLLSKNVDPFFTNPLLNNYSPNNGVIDAVALPLGITDDINNATRSLTTPDIGAYEFAPPSTPPSCVSSVTVNNTTCITGTTLSWTPAAGFPTGYTIYFGTDGGGSTLPVNSYTPGNVLSFILPALTPGATYYYSVAPYNNAGENTCSIFSFVSNGTSITQTPTQSASSYIETMDNGVIPPLLPCGTTSSSENFPVDAFTWYTASGAANAHSGTRYLRIDKNTNNVTAKDDWFYSAPMNLTAGKLYRIYFWHRVSLAGSENFEVFLSNSNDAASMLTTSAVFNGVSNLTTYKLDSTADIIPLFSGIYYYGFHANGAPNGVSLYMDDIQVREIPVAALNPASCTTLASMYDQIFVQPVLGAQDYKFKVENLANSFSYEYTRNLAIPDFRLKWAPGVVYDLTYDVSVSYKKNNVWSPYGPPCPVTMGPFPTTKLRTISCNSTITDQYTQLHYDSISGANDYEIKIVQNTLSYDHTWIRGGSQTDYRMYWAYQSSPTLVERVPFGFTYDVQVRALVGRTGPAQGNLPGVLGTFGPVCTVTLSGAPQTQLQGASCGALLLNITDPIYCIPVTGASDYQYEIVNTAIGFNATVNRNSSATDYRLNWIPASAGGVRYGTTYDVRVRAKVGGVFLTFGPMCQVTTPAQPMTQLQMVYCPYTLPTFSTTVYSQSILGATNYRYRITDLATSGATYTKIVDRNSPGNDFKFNWTLVCCGGLNMLPNTAYNVEVASYAGVWSSYGPMCVVTTGASVPRYSPFVAEEGLVASAASSLNLNVYPNPAAVSEEYSIELDGIQSANETIEIDIYNMLGEKVYRTEIETKEESRLIIKPEHILAPGVYMVEARINGTSNKVKFVVK